MKKIIIILSIIASSNTNAFTLNNNFGASFKTNKVSVRVAGNTVCNNLRVDELQSMIEPAVKDFWNRVPTSALRLSVGSYTDPINNINNGYLCPPTDDQCISQASTIPPVNDIVIACNTNNGNFSNSSNVLAVTVPNHFSGKSIEGAVILINDNSSAFASLPRNEQISVIAHEIGHAIGLGHSDTEASLMFFRTTDHRERLGQDDIDGVSYLYPVKVDACGLMGTIEETKTPPFMTMIGVMFLMIIMSEIFKLFKRSKRSATL